MLGLLAGQANAQTLGTQSITIGKDGGSSTVTLSYPGGGWSAAANDSFLHVAPGSTSGSGSASVSFTADAFSGQGTRNGSLTIAGVTLAVVQTGVNSTAVQTVSDLVTVGAGSVFHLTSDGAGNVYYIVGNTVRKWTASTQQISTLVSSGLNGPAGLAVDTAGNVYISDFNNNIIKVWTAATQLVTNLVSGILNPGALAVDSAGNLYFAVSGKINKWDATSHVVTQLALVGLPQGVVGKSEIVGHPSFATAIGLLGFPHRQDGQWGSATQRRRARGASFTQKVREWVEQTF